MGFAGNIGRFIRVWEIVLIAVLGGLGFIVIFILCLVSGIKCCKFYKEAKEEDRRNAEDRKRIEEE